MRAELSGDNPEWLLTVYVTAEDMAVLRNQRPLQMRLPEQVPGKNRQVVIAYKNREVDKWLQTRIVPPGVSHVCILDKVMMQRLRQGDWITSPLNRQGYRVRIMKEQTNEVIG